MKTFKQHLLAIFALFAFVVGSAFTTPMAAELELGKKAPKSDFKMMDITGKKLSMEDMKGKNGLLVIFSCNTCPWVLAWEDRYNELAALAKSKDIGMVGVNSNEAKRADDDSMEQMKAHATEMKYKFNYVLDTNSQLADALGATRTPHVYLFNSDLKLMYRGAIDDNSKDASAVTHPYLKNAITNMALGKEIDPETTRSLGCSIKRKN